MAVISGPGEWSAPVSPVTYADVEIWRDDHWELSELRPSPLGLEFGYGTFRVAGTVGNDDSPGADALEAYRRYAEFLAETAKRPGYESWSMSVEGSFSLNWRRARNALARGVYGSGAADMLRKYRRAR